MKHEDPRRKPTWDDSYRGSRGRAVPEGDIGHGYWITQSGERRIGHDPETDNRSLEIVALYREGGSRRGLQKELAKRYGISTGRIRQILMRGGVDLKKYFTYAPAGPWVDLGKAERDFAKAEAANKAYVPGRTYPDA